jgi:GNAT superfamily N-acetyltransferase
MTEPPLRIRTVRLTDAGLVAQQRARMFQEMGELAESDWADFVAAARPRLEEAIADGVYQGWLMTLPDGQAVGGAGVLLRPILPRPGATHGPEAIVLNVYVERDFRLRGIARALMQALLDWCKAEGIRRIVLHATPSGRPLYEALGFAATNEMRYQPERALPRSHGD